jgi:hypothetical protein
MKLHEEFKEYENLWEATAPPNFIRTLGNKNYNLNNTNELKAFIDDSLVAAVKKDPAKYANDNFHRDAYWSTCYKIFEDLINSFKNDPDAEIYYRNFINKLYKMRDKYLDEIEDTYDSNKQDVKAEIIKLAKLHVQNFINDLHKVGEYNDYRGSNVGTNLHQPYMPELIEDAEDELFDLGKSLLVNYWID